MLPLSDLKPADRALLESLAAEHPLARGNSKVTVVADVRPVKKTIERSSVEGPLETVQLCPPSLLRDQHGPTCELYAIVHCLDISGFYVELPEIYKIENMVEASSPTNPWGDPRYEGAMNQLILAHVPRGGVHKPAATKDPFAWARDEVRRGHPVLAAFTEEIWRGLPASFIAAHSWDGGKEGHAIVINGFTLNKDTGQGTFHIINSWRDLSDFDLSTEAAKGLLVMQWSLSAKNEVEPAAVREAVTKVTLIRPAGKVNLYQVETNLGTHRVAAPDEDGARALVESQGGAN